MRLIVARLYPVVNEAHCYKVVSTADKQFPRSSALTSTASSAKKTSKMNANSTSEANANEQVQVPCRVDSVGSVSASHTVGREFASRPGHTKDHQKNGTNCIPAWQAMR